MLNNKYIEVYDINLFKQHLKFTPYKHDFGKKIN